MKVVKYILSALFIFWENIYQYLLYKLITPLPNQSHKTKQQ